MTGYETTVTVVAAADGFTVRYLEAGEGEPVVYFHGGGGLHMSRALDLLGERFRVLAFELPGFGRSPENTRTQSLDDLGETMARAIDSAMAARSRIIFPPSLGRRYDRAA